MDAALIAIGVLGPVAIAIFTFLSRRARRGAGSWPRPGTNRADRLDRQVRHYRASGALPR